MMIATPKWSEIPFSVMLMGGVGYAIGKIGEINSELTASVLTIQVLTDHVFFHLARLALSRSAFSFSPQAIYAATNAFNSILALVAARQLDLISRRTAGLMGFLSAAILVARVKIIHAQAF